MTFVQSLRQWAPLVALLMTFGLFIPAVWVVCHEKNLWFAIFCTLFILRYTRFIGHVVGYFLYRPSEMALNPRFNRSDVTVIVPTVAPGSEDFRECISTILANQPGQLIVVTVGRESKEECGRVLRSLAAESEGTAITVSAIAQPSQRRQIAHAVRVVLTPITILADDHVFWPSRGFLPSVLAPFEDDRVAAVVTKKRVRRSVGPCEFSWSSVVNFIAQNCFERHNWELRSSTALDGGVFVVSSRTAAYRTDFLADEDLLTRFCNEKFLFGKIAHKELQPDGDSFLTRELLSQRLLIRFQDTEDATVETTLGEWPKFSGQLLRWSRTSFRSNVTMLFRQPSFTVRYTWTAFMVYWTGLVNFAVVWDGLLLFFLVQSLKSADDTLEFAASGWIVVFVLWLITTKVWKILPALLRHPPDCFLVPFQIMFAYLHSFYKLWALLTFWDCGTSSRTPDDTDSAENGQSGIMLDELTTLEISI